MMQNIAGMLIGMTLLANADRAAAKCRTGPSTATQRVPATLRRNSVSVAVALPLNHEPVVVPNVGLEWYSRLRTQTSHGTNRQDP